MSLSRNCASDVVDPDTSNAVAVATADLEVSYNEETATSAINDLDKITKFLLLADDRRKGIQLLKQLTDSMLLLLSTSINQELIKKDSINIRPLLKIVKHTISQLDKFWFHHSHSESRRKGEYQWQIIVEMMKILLVDIGLDPNAVDDKGNTSLHLILSDYNMTQSQPFWSPIASFCLTQIIQLFMVAGFNQEQTNNAGETIFHLLKRHKRAEPRLLPWFEPVYTQTVKNEMDRILNFTNCPLNDETSRPITDEIKRCLIAYTDFNTGRPLITIVQRMIEEIGEFDLLRLESRLKGEDHWRKMVDVFRILLVDIRLDPNATDSNGNSSLHLILADFYMTKIHPIRSEIASLCLIQIVQLFVDAGINLEQTSKQHGETVFDLLKRSPRLEKFLLP